MDAIFPALFGIVFIIIGIVFAIHVKKKYTLEEHDKQLKEWNWIREVKFFSWVEWEVALFHRLASKSYMFAKVAFYLCAFVFILVGAFSLFIAYVRLFG
ncbi:hypothetical protein SM124_06080 [Bacillus sp. 31A1R]|uniref:Uncharacterized protein n=1 Tax=Robertmurraya mangrovi TaxID=3098077 RepID=A0ABU5IVZ6_9BACI|nr:hypothetical protein [Bacillus sp. 31A1R]MDZ5471311.1 hypothetical protein [Bacillus sp. 31A1R]